MTADELNEQVKEALFAGATVGQLCAIVRTFAASGGGQKEAIDILENLRKVSNEEQEDRLLDALDFVGGFCSPEARIFPPPDQS